MKKLLTCLLMFISVFVLVSCGNELIKYDDEWACDNRNLHHWIISNKDNALYECDKCGYVKYYSEGLDYEYIEAEDGYRVTGIGSCEDTWVIVPKEYNGKKVISTASDAFYNCDCVRITFLGSISVQIRDLSKTVQSVELFQTEVIGFSPMYSILEIFDHKASEVKRNTKFTSRAQYLFNDINESLITVYENGLIAYQEETEKLLLGYQEEKELVVIPNEISSFTKDIFKNCTKLKKVEFEANPIINNFEMGAFEGCTGLEYFLIPKGITNIHQKAFKGCSNLKKVEFEKGSQIEFIYHSVFEDCSKLEDINLPNNKDLYIDYYAFKNCTSLVKISLPDKLLSIPAYFFENCTSLEKIVLPAGIKSVDNGAFSGCEKLESITYKGTTKQWEQLTKGNEWDLNSSITVIHCSDGDVF